MAPIHAAVGENTSIYWPITILICDHQNQQDLRRKKESLPCHQRRWLHLPNAMGGRRAMVDATAVKTIVPSGGSWQTCISIFTKKEENLLRRGICAKSWGPLSSCDICRMALWAAAGRVICASWHWPMWMRGSNSSTNRDNFALLARES